MHISKTGSSQRASAALFSGLFVGAPLMGLALLSACATPTPGAQPDDMSAAGHRAAAQSEAAEANIHAEQYDPAASAGIAAPVASASVGDADVSSSFTTTYNPTAVHAAAAAEHKRHASDHLAAAQTLEKFEEGACHAFTPETRALCPLMGQTQSVVKTPKGARVTLAESADGAAVDAHIQCHLAYARTQGHKGMNSCPLYLDGIKVTRTAAGALDFVTEDASQREELRKRLAEHVSHH